MSLNLPPTTPLSLGFPSAYEKVMTRTSGGNVPSVPSVPLSTSVGDGPVANFANSYSDYATKKAYSRIADDKKAREMKLTGYYPSKLTNIFNSGATGLSGSGAFTSRSKVTSLIQNLLSERATQLNKMETPIDTGIDRIGMAPKSVLSTPSEAGGYFDTLSFLMEKITQQFKQGYFSSILFEDLTKVWKIISTYGYLLDESQLLKFNKTIKEIGEAENVATLRDTFKSKAPLLLSYIKMIGDMGKSLYKIRNRSLQEKELATPTLASLAREGLTFREVGVSQPIDRIQEATEGRGRKSYRK
jgi:hypothetical protein